MCASSQTKILVKAYPNSPKNELIDFANGILRVRMSAPPVKDKANKELIAFLSRCLGLSKDSVSILRGHTSRNKVIAIAGLSHKEVIERLFPGTS